MAEVGGELRPGDYSLVSYQDPSIGETQLHLLLHFCCERELLSNSQCVSSFSLYNVTSVKVKHLVNTNHFEIPTHHNTNTASY